ncbi:alpha/beta fold hydrolase [Emticicia sp. BO119]|uniref:alpha/beta fold hydrolase n=1 Tax=Emticicia sp. BO119 TaxID=2757768 RepID=UPI0015F0DA48|nr:alpha/beta hydrolase [Emticicia sp. BO119]MBA4853834.1 alpha/beta hydrolase [Emticicia sp. BO119]
MKILITFFAIVLICNSYAQEKLVNVNGKNFAVYTKGFENRKANAPVLIFENGMGVGIGSWNTVIDELAKTAPVMAYDRQGVEKSDKIYQMPTPKITAGNLKALLTTLNIAPPYVVVGHSMGGLYARSFAGYYPDDIAGLVFVDPADFTESKDDWNQIFREIGVPEKRIDEMMYNRLYQPKQLASRSDSLNFGPWSERQELGELRRTDFAEVKNLPLPNVPIYFFVGGKFEVPPANRSKDYDHERFFHVKNSKNIERWLQFIHSSGKGGALLYLSNSGHYIHRDDAKAVIANIRLLLEGL